MNTAKLLGKFTGGNVSQWLVLAGWSCVIWIIADAISP